MGPISLKNKVVLITGGSRGLGAVIAKKFAAEGSKIAINYNSNKADAENLLKEIGRDKGIVLQGVCCVLSWNWARSPCLGGVCRGLK